METQTRVEQVSTPKLPTQTSLPQKFVDFFAGRGLRLSWQMANSEILGYVGAMKIVPLTKTMLERDAAELLKLVSDDDTIPEIDGEAPLYFNAAGQIQRGDSVVCVQRETVHEAYAASARGEHVRKRSQAAEELEKLAEQIRKIQGVHVTQVQTGDD